MDCRELEERLEALLDGELAELARRRCARHLESCPSCRELAAPFAVAPAPPDDLVDAVLAGTSGSPCGRSEALMCGWLDGEAATGDDELMTAHLETCADCRALAAAMTRLAAELPELAELRPGPGFVEAVLAATLPVRVRLRRWWAAAWPRWVRRPRFASEAAFAATMALVIVVATPGSPLQALPSQALVLARTDPAAQIGEQLEARLESPVAALEESFAARVGRPIGERFARGEAEVRAWTEAAEARGREAGERLTAWIGTTRERLASLLESADDTASENRDDESNPNQETP